MLGLERVASALPVEVAGDAHQRAVEEVAAVELHAGLVRPDGQLATAGDLLGVGGEVQAVRSGRGVSLRVQDPVVVVALRDKELVVRRRRVVRCADVTDPAPDGVRGAEVECP